MDREGQPSGEEPHVNIPPCPAPGAYATVLPSTNVTSVWRPLVDVVETDPLVLCDTQTLEDSDWDVVQKILDKSVEESMYLKRQQRHQWYWMSDQTKDDVIVMTIWDSKHPEKRSGKSISRTNHLHCPHADASQCLFPIALWYFETPLEARGLGRVSKSGFLSGTRNDWKGSR